MDTELWDAMGSHACVSFNPAGGGAFSFFSLFFFPFPPFSPSFRCYPSYWTGTDFSSLRPAAAASAAAPPGSSLPVRKLLVLPPRGPSSPSWFARARTHTHVHTPFRSFVWFRLVSPLDFRPPLLNNCPPHGGKRDARLRTGGHPPHRGDPEIRREMATMQPSSTNMWIAFWAPVEHVDRPTFLTNPSTIPIDLRIA